MGIANVHGQFRQIFPTKDNTYLIPLMGKGEVIELTRSNEVIRRIAVGGNPFSVKVMKDGNWIVACGDAHKYVTVDPGGQIVKKSVQAADISKVSMLFVAEPHCRPNGNIMIANWNGHSKDKNQPSLFEIDSKSRIVWELPAATLKDGKISAFYPFREK